MANPYAQYANPYGQTPAGFTPLGAPSPEYQKALSTLPLSVPTAQAQLEQTGASAASSRASAARTMAEVPYVGAQAAADVASKEAGAREQTVKAGIAEATAEAAKREAVAKANTAQATNLGGGALDSIVGQLNDVAAKFAAGPGATHGLAGLEDYLPGAFNQANAAFDKSAVNLATQATGAFRVPGSGVSSDKDDARIDASALVNRYSPDSSNVQLLGDLRRRIDATRAAHGLAPAQWNQFVPNPDAQTVQQGLPAAGAAQAGGIPSAAAGGLPPGWTGPSGPAGGPTIATGATRLEDLPAVNALFESGLKSGLSNTQINAMVAAAKGNPASDDQLNTLRAYLKTHPKYTGFANAQREVPTTGFQRVAGSPVGAFGIGAADAVTAGNMDSLAGLVGGDPNAVRQGVAASSAASPVSNLLGSIAGGGVAAAATGMGLGGLSSKLAASAPKVAGLLANPLTADAVYGGAYGAGSSDDNRLAGGLGGAVAGLAGGAVGRKLGGMFGARFSPAGSPTALNGGERATLNALNGVPNAQQALQEASGLGVPMGLGDLVPSLAGAAARRSPTVGRIAEDALIPRGRGQIDRFGQAVARDLGPVANVPQLSQDLSAQARTAAAPLYDRAYANPAVGSPELDSLLNTPAARSALARARTIAGNERRNPEAMGFALDDRGNVVLNPANPDLHGALASAKSTRDDLASQLDALQARAGASLSPSQFSGQIGDLTGRLSGADDALARATAQLGQAPTAGVAATGPQYTPQTLDYVKRGIDDVIDGLPKGMNGRPIMDENYRAVDGVRRQLLGEVDRLNPDYAAARAAYAGPASSREALNLGADALGMAPNELGILTANQSPERLAQMQLGYRSSLVDKARSMRDAGNPFDAASTLGAPAARDRIDTLFPNNPGNANLFRTRDLESQLARSTNDIIGNSKTAGRHIADEAFAPNPLVEGALHAGAAVATHGASIPGTAARLLGTGIKDRLQLGLGNAAVRKADQIAPLVFDTNPDNALATLGRLTSADDIYRDYVNGLRSRRVGGMFGAGFGAALTPLVNR